MKIYVLMGGLGDYSGHEEWIVKAFTSEEKAEEAKMECEKQSIKYANELRAWQKINHPNLGWPRCSEESTPAFWTKLYKTQEEHMKQFKPTLDPRSDLSATYFVVETELD